MTPTNYAALFGPLDDTAATTIASNAEVDVRTVWKAYAGGPIRTHVLRDRIDRAIRDHFARKATDGAP